MFTSSLPPPGFGEPEVAPDRIIAARSDTTVEEIWIRLSKREIAEQRHTKVEIQNFNGDFRLLVKRAVLSISGAARPDGRNEFTAPLLWPEVNEAAIAFRCIRQ